MIRYFDVQGIYEYFLFMGGICPGGNCPVGIVLDGNCLGGNCPGGNFRAGIVRDGNCPQWELSGGN